LRLPGVAGRPVGCDRVAGMRVMRCAARDGPCACAVWRRHAMGTHAMHP
jgi:hypothetical protein